MVDDVAETGAGRTRRVGVILVHGVGQQRRFDHLEYQGRQILWALRDLAKTGTETETGGVTVDILGHASAGYLGAQETWSSGPDGSVVAYLHYDNGCGATRHEVHLHEVWWADVNEPYTLWKQLRFWLWGIGIWAFPRGKNAKIGGADIKLPEAPELQTIGKRALFFITCTFAVMTTLPIGFALSVAQRVFSLQRLDPFRTVTDYLSAVKIFNQRERFGASLSPVATNADYLDTLGQPPRVSIRRRMIRTIATVAAQNYEAWYIVAHSQGTVLALNGLMETDEAWPGYFSCAEWAGVPSKIVRGAASNMPPRPIWCQPDEVADRRTLFRSFRGLLTLGSPLETFAAIWPARVPMNGSQVFVNAQWINAYDPMDPVSGVLEAFKSSVLKPINVGVRSSWVLLWSHLTYLTARGEGTLANVAARWILGEKVDFKRDLKVTFQPKSVEHKMRFRIALTSFAMLFLAVAGLGGIALRWFGVQLAVLMSRIPMLRIADSHVCGNCTRWATTGSDITLRRVVHGGLLLIVASAMITAIGGARWLLPSKAEENPDR